MPSKSWFSYSPDSPLSPSPLRSLIVIAVALVLCVPPTELPPVAVSLAFYLVCYLFILKCVGCIGFIGKLVACRLPIETSQRCPRQYPTQSHTNTHKLVPSTEESKLSSRLGFCSVRRALSLSFCRLLSDISFICGRCLCLFPGSPMTL